MIVNDDLNAFGDFARRMGQAAARVEDELCYAILTANTAMADGGNLFNSTSVTTTGGHANLASGTGNVGAPSVALIGKGMSAMARQSAGGSALNLMAQHLIVPVEIYLNALEITNSTVKPGATNSTTNVLQNALTVTAEPRLSANSTTAWYLAADSGQADTVRIAFIDGEREPNIVERDGFETDAREYRVRHIVGAVAADWRGLFKNPGA